MDNSRNGPPWAKNPVSVNAGLAFSATMEFLTTSGSKSSDLKVPFECSSENAPEGREDNRPVT